MTHFSTFHQFILNMYCVLPSLIFIAGETQCKFIPKLYIYMYISSLGYLYSKQAITCISTLNAIRWIHISTFVLFTKDSSYLYLLPSLLVIFLTYYLELCNNVTFLFLTLQIFIIAPLSLPRDIKLYH